MQSKANKFERMGNSKRGDIKKNLVTFFVNKATLGSSGKRNMNNEIQFILYQLPDEEGRVQVVIKDETIWATQKAMAQLFGVDKSGISRHIANIFKDGELRQETTVAKIATVVNRGIRGEVEELIDFYNLDAIIAVGYRISSARATKFRIWATKILT